MTDARAFRTEGPYTGPERRAHGQRRTYQAGCKCLPCRAANATYEATYRQQKASGQAPLGSLVPASRTHIVMKALRAEMSKTQLCLQLRWGRNYARVQQAPRITLRTALKVQRVWRRSREGMATAPLPFEQAQIVRDTLEALGQ